MVNSHTRARKRRVTNLSFTECFVRCWIGGLLDWGLWAENTGEHGRAIESHLCKESHR